MEWNKICFFLSISRIVTIRTGSINAQLHGRKRNHRDACAFLDQKKLEGMVEL